ncbi:ABC transporter permease subunit, partial [Paenibacillus polymyxa]|nr:ABC transporter permease subunit [Paenibacillus polymyxa]
QKARAAIDSGRFRDEIVPVSTQRQNGEALIVDTDAQPRTDASAEGLAKLDPAFETLGSVTAGNSSSINAGAAAVMMMSESKAQELALPVLALVMLQAGSLTRYVRASMLDVVKMDFIRTARAKGL